MKLMSDGTLVVSVEDATKVTRVLVEDEQKNGCLYYADRPQGEWIGYNADKEDWLRTDGIPIFLVCDKCHETVVSNASAHWNFCPNCGARMKGADDE